jgi:flagellar motor switch protein FliN
MKSYLDCWVGVAEALFPQALAGEPELVESLPEPLGANAFGFAATLSGDVGGRFAVMLEGTALESPLLGEGVDQKAGWAELLREVAGAAAAEVRARTGKECRVENVEETAGETGVTRAFQLRSAGRTWTMLLRDEVRSAEPAAEGTPPDPKQVSAPDLTPGIELLLDVLLEASIRFGSREMPLGEVLDLGPGDVVQLDRHVADPVDLIVGDKIVARGEVVQVNGNFGLRVTEVAAPRKRLESIRCLF